MVKILKVDIFPNLERELDMAFVQLLYVALILFAGFVLLAVNGLQCLLHLSQLLFEHHRRMMLTLERLRLLRRIRQLQKYLITIDRCVNK